MSVETKPPALTRDDARRLALEHWGITGAVEPLPSERDRNFRLTTESGERFVLKVAGGTEPLEHLALQNAALAWIADRDELVPIPAIRPTLSGEPLVHVEQDDGLVSCARVLTYLPGTVLANTVPHSPELLRDLGGSLGRINRALQGFSHPAARRDLYWDLARALEIIDRNLSVITTPEQRALIERVRRMWERTVAPVLPTLRRSVIYNDANDYNVLVGEPEGRHRRVTGFVDFGDMLENPTVCDLAIAVAYAMLGKTNPLAAAREVASGFHHTFPLTEQELDVLFPLACARLAVSVAIAARRRHDGADDAYLVISEASAWEALAKLAAVHQRLARNLLRHACGLEPCPDSARVRSWLSDHAEAFGAVLQPDPRTAPSIDIDLSIASPLVEDPAIVGTEAFGDLVFGSMRDAGVDLAIGHYDEARIIYTTEAFAGPAGEHAERRTVHLGLDIFAQPGLPVHAPLDGRIHSVRDNADPLDYGPTVILEHTPMDGLRFYTLYGHLAEDALELAPGTPLVTGQPFARVGAFAVNGGWPPHLHFQIVTDLLDRDGEFPGVAAPSEREVWLSLSPDPDLVLQLPRGSHPPAVMARGTLLDERRRRLGPSLSLSYAAPLHLVRGRGQYLYNSEGREYLDGVNNVCHVGHCHPRVVRAAREQMAVLNTNTRYLHETAVRYAQRLCDTLPDPLGVCYFVCSGSEANELALRMARAHTGAEDIVVLEGGYHGNTGALVGLSHYKFAGPGGTGAPAHVHTAVMPDDYRGPYRRDDPECGAKYAGHVRDAIASAQLAGRRVAAFLVESLLGCGGQIELPPGYLAAAFAHARAAGAVCIADEVQVGFGRVGTHFWGFETQDVVPDIVTLGKPIGNGHPLGAVVTTPDIAASFATGMEYFNTFGGNPVSCAVGLAVLDVIRDEGLQERAMRIGARLKERLRSLMDRHLVVGDVRGRGMFLGVELVTDREARTPAAAHADYVIERLKDHGILLSTDGPDRNVIKIKPPLAFSEEDAARLVATLDMVLAEDFIAGLSG